MALGVDDGKSEEPSPTDSPIGPLRAQFGRQTADSTGDSSPQAAGHNHDRRKKDDTRVSFGVSVAAKNRAMLAANSPRATQESGCSLSSETKAIITEPSYIPIIVNSSAQADAAQPTASARRRASDSDAVPASDREGGMDHELRIQTPRRNTIASRCVGHIEKAYVLPCKDTNVGM